ncbi:MAG TPA: recombinase RecT [Methanocorpusculum sp.]|nr:recombinase RecT [Methanocorpusculum sp.]HJJ57854.1 recombinase RecT [Methanocorpusculum sp.]
METTDTIIYSENEMKLIRENIFADCSDFEYLQGMRVIEKYGIDVLQPGQFSVQRRFDKKTGAKKATFTVGHSVYISLAHRMGMKKMWHEMQFEESDTLKQHPICDICHIERFDGGEFSKPTYFKDYYQAGFGLWDSKPHVMLEKCAEGATIRIAFDISGLYSREEIAVEREEDKALADHLTEEGENLTPALTVPRKERAAANPKPAAGEKSKADFAAIIGATPEKKPSSKTCSIVEAQSLLNQMAKSAVNPRGYSDEELTQIFQDAKLPGGLFNYDFLKGKLLEVS